MGLFLTDSNGVDRHLPGEDYVSLLCDLLRLGADSIMQTAQRLQPGQIKLVIELLKNCDGKVVLVGAGKSGIVANKIAATLTSTGTCAVYMHPSDALHGDIGIVNYKDVIVILSNSGETEEVIALLPHFKRRQVPIIAIVGNTRSTLARNAHAVIDASVHKEACPFNLAPTTSTTVALAIGDALAITLMQIKGLTPEHFAFNHPGGRLGKRLTLRVCDLMYAHEANPRLLPDASWIDVINVISDKGLGAVNIVDESNCLIGIITDGDLRRAIQKIRPAEFEGLKAEMIMTHNPVAVAPDMLAYEALQLMENRSSQISVLSVIDANRCCVGLIRLHDIVRSGL